MESQAQLAQIMLQKKTDKKGRQFLICTFLLLAIIPIAGFKTALTLLTIWGFLNAIWLKDRERCFYGVTLLCVLDPMTRVFLLEGGWLRWNTLNYWLLIVQLIHIKYLLRMNQPQILIFKIFIIWLMAGVLFSPDKMFGLQQVLGAMSLFGLIPYFIFVLHKPKVFYWQALIAASSAGVSGTIFFLENSATLNINPNALVHSFVTALVALCFTSFKLKNTKFGKELLILAGINSVLVFLTASRGGMLVAFFCLCYFLLDGKHLIKKFLFISLIFCAAVAGAKFFSGQYQYSLHRINKGIDSKESLEGRTSGRSAIAKLGYKIFLKNPLGVGTGGFAGRYAEESLKNNLSGFHSGTESQAHSGFIKILTENGFPGIFLFIAFILLYIFQGWRIGITGAGKLGIWISSILIVIFLSSEFQAKSIWFLSSGGIALLYFDKSNRQKKLLVKEKNQNAQ